MPPAPLYQPEENKLGTGVFAQDVRFLRVMEGAVVRALPGLKRPPRVAFWIAPARADLSALARWYRSRAAKRGWTPVADFGRSLPPGGRGVAFTTPRPAPGRVFAVIWLDRPVGRDGDRSVMVFRFEPDRRGYNGPRSLRPAGSPPSDQE